MHLSLLEYKQKKSHGQPQLKLDKKTCHQRIKTTQDKRGQKSVTLHNCKATLKTHTGKKLRRVLRIMKQDRNNKNYISH